MISTAPLTGLVIKPASPLPVPLMNPLMPSFLAPSTGFVTIPVIPEPIDVNADPKPFFSPSKPDFGFSRTALISFSCINYVSVDKNKMPLFTELTIFPTDPKVALPAC